MKININNQSSESTPVMTKMQEAVYEVEAFLSENYLFRRNILNGKIEALRIVENEDQHESWLPLTPEYVTSIVRKAKKAGVGGEASPRQNIEEYIFSDATTSYDPVLEFMNNLPEWDGHNHVADLFGRLPGITSEQMSWCTTWMRSAVAHWLGMDMQHGNECLPVIIGSQGCGKSTFAYRLLPESLREYYLDHINFANKFDSEMALTHNLLVNIDEFANMGASQQGKLKQTLSKVKVNSRPIFGKTQEDRRRYASFLATTNDEHPLCDPTGSRRFLCMTIKKGHLIDNITPIPYKQLYAQLLHELRVDETPYWFSNDDVQRIQQANIPYFRTDDMESLLQQCYRLPENEDEGEWLTCKEVCQSICKMNPIIRSNNATKIKIGQTLKYLDCPSMHTRRGALYRLIRLTA